VVILDVCGLCGGLGFLRIYAGDGRTSARCPACHGGGGVEPWRQAGGTGREGWRYGPTRRRDDADVRFALRVRAEREFRWTNR